MFKFDQIQKLDHGQKPTKWAQALGTRVIHRRGVDFSGSCAISVKTFIVAVLPGI